MPDVISDGNKTARRRALTAGRLTYQYQVVDAWPACVECATPIRHRSGERGRLRRCACPDARWWCGMDGWTRESANRAEGVGHAGPPTEEPSA